MASHDQQAEAVLDRLRTWAELWRGVEGDDSELRAARDFITLDGLMSRTGTRLRAWGRPTVPPCECECNRGGF